MNATEELGFPAPPMMVASSALISECAVATGTVVECAYWLVPAYKALRCLVQANESMHATRTTGAHRLTTANWEDAFCLVRVGRIALASKETREDARAHMGAASRWATKAYLAFLEATAQAQEGNALKAAEGYQLSLTYCSMCAAALRQAQ